MNTQIIEQTASEKSSQPVDARAALQQGFARIRTQIQAVLPTHITVEKFERVALTAINNNPDLLAADRRSFFNSCQRAAQDGLLPDGREGALVIFKDFKTGKQMVQWMPMVFGIIKKIRQSGEVSSITAHIVYDREISDGLFSYVLGDDERIEHRRYLGTDRGKPALVYATCKFKDGGVEREVLTIADVDKARAVSKTGKSERGPWAQWWDEMARKTAIRKLSKRLPLSADDRRTIEREDDDSDFAKQRAQASEMLKQAASQISAPAPAITHQAEADDDGVLDGEVTAAGPILGTVDVDAQQRAAEAEEIVSEGDAKEAVVAARDRTDALITELAAMTTTDELTAYVKDIGPDLAELPEDERGRFNVARYKREKTLKGVGK
jgi:recombination protein RecT